MEIKSITRIQLGKMAPNHRSTEFAVHSLSFVLKLHCILQIWKCIVISVEIIFVAFHSASKCRKTSVTRSRCCNAQNRMQRALAQCSFWTCKSRFFTALHRIFETIRWPCPFRYIRIFDSQYSDVVINSCVYVNHSGRRSLNRSALETILLTIDSFQMLHFISRIFVLLYSILDQIFIRKKRKRNSHVWNVLCRIF